MIFVRVVCANPRYAAQRSPSGHLMDGVHSGRSVHRCCPTPKSSRTVQQIQQMDDNSLALAKRRHGVVTADDLGSNAARKAKSRGLVSVQPKTFLAVTQPYGVQAQLASLQAAFPEGGWRVMGHAALWLYGLRPCPDRLEVGIPLFRRLAVRRPVRCRRVADSILRRTRLVKGVPVVALEVAIIQAGERRPLAEVVRLVEEAVRARRTTVARLRAACRHGFAGSALVRAACDELVGGSMDKAVRLLKAALERRGVVGLEVEVRFENGAGGSAYGDLVHAETDTVIELDGFLSHSCRERFRADRRRDRWLLGQHGKKTLRFDVEEVFADVEAVADELVGFLLPGADVAA